MNTERKFGTVVRGLRGPIIRQGDDLKKILVNTFLEAVEQEQIPLNNRDILCVTEAVVARAQGNYATIHQIGEDVREKLGGKTIGVIFPILSRNRFAICLRGIARGAEKIVLMLSYPCDEVGNHLIDPDVMDEKNVNPYSDQLTLEQYRELFGYEKHTFTGVDYVEYYQKLIQEEGAECEVIFSNDPRTVLQHTSRVLTCDIHSRKRTKRILKEGGAELVFGLDEILNDELCAPETLEKKYSLNFSQPVLMVLQHPATSGEDAPNQMKETMEAILETGCQTMVIYPNSDAGGRKMIKVIENYRKYPFIKIFKNLDRKDFLSLMNFSRVLIGNSSSGIIEAPLFHLPVINLGERLEGRERSENIIDTVCKKNEIIKAMKTVLSDKAFLKKIKRCGSPYGNGFAGVKIAQVLAHIPINQALLQKKIIY